MVGETISHYRVLEKIGEGGMGEVYLAEDTSLERKVALKFLPASLHADDVAHKRFLREAKSAAAIDHPYICNIYEVSQTDDGQDYIVMEYVDGQTLTDRLQKGRLPLKEALRLGSKVAQALERAHKGGVIHRDLKPSNIMITPDGHPKVMDFGLAKRVSRDQEDLTSQLTREGTTLGTLAYMSPEQLRGETVDTRSDIFSFGIVLYEMLTGVHPFRKETQAATSHGILGEECARLSAYLEDVPDLLQHMVDKLLKKDKDHRFQTLHDARTDLTELAEISGPQVMRRARRRRGLGRGLAAGLLLAAAAVFLLWDGYLPVSETPAEPLRVVRLTSERGMYSSPSFSPDGKQIVYHSFDLATNTAHLYIGSLDSADRLPLTSGSTLNGWPAWSPKGQEIAFVRFEDQTWKKAELYLISYPGRVQRKIHDLELAVDAAHNPSLLSWFPDGDSLAVANRIPGSTRYGIIQLDIKSGDITTLSEPPVPELHDRVPCISPDGKSLAFVRGLPWGGDYDLLVRPVTQGEPTRLNRDSYHIIGGLAWTPDSREICYIATEMLWRIAADGGTPQPIAGGQAGWSLSVSPKGRRLVYVSYSEIIDIWRFPGPRSTAAERVASELIVSDSTDMSADFSPDSGQIAFASTRRRWPHNIWVCDADGRSNLRQLTTTEVGANNPQWSPDGEWIAFGSSQEIFVVRSSGVGAPRRITKGTTPSWSRDGKWIYFNSESSGELQIWKVPVEEGPAPGEPIQVTANGGGYAQEGPHGDILYYCKPEESDVSSIPLSGVWSIPIGGGEEILVLDRKVQPLNWHVADGGIYFYSSKSLQQYELETGEVTVVLNRDHTVWNLTVSPDGEWIVWDEQGEIDSQLMLLENFQ